MLNPFHFYSWGMWLPHRNCDTEFSCCKRFGALLICRAELSWAASYSGMYVYVFLFVVQVRFSTLMNDWMKSLTLPQYMECCLYDILLYKGNKSRGERARDFPVLGMPPDQLGVAFWEVRGGESKIGMPRLPISFYSPQSPKSSFVSCSSSLPTNVTFPSTRKFTGDSGKVLFILQLVLLFMVLSVWSCENWKTRHKVEELRLFNGAHQGGPIRSRPHNELARFTNPVIHIPQYLRMLKWKKTNSIYLWP